MNVDYRPVLRVLFSSIIFVFTVLLIGCAPSVRVGEQLYREGRYSEAVQRLEEFVRANPDDAMGHYVLADSLYLKYSAEYHDGRADGNDLNLALLHFSEAIKRNPSYAEAYGQRGVVRLTLGDVEGARQDYDKAIELKPRLDRVYFNRGYWFEQQQRYAEAITDYETYVALSRDPQWIADANLRITRLRNKNRIQKLHSPQELVM